MKKLILLLFVIAFVSFQGCSSTHNAQHIKAIKTDLNSMHDDIDSFLGLNKPSSLRGY